MAKVGVVISNLGTPSSADPDDVGAYLKEFLMDPMVIQIPYFFRFLLVKGIIAPFRKSKSAANYKKVWTEQGSPLLVETQRMANSLQAELGEDFKVVVAMRYGEPSFEQAKQQLKDCESVVFFPQYPQYAASTVKTSVEHFYKFFDQSNSTVIKPYFEDSFFIKSYGKFLKEKFQELDFDHLLMSFHGLPESHLRKEDPSSRTCLSRPNCCKWASPEVVEKCYRAQCMRTASALARELELDSSSYSVSFQSRLGRQKWIEPYTEDMYGELVQCGVKKLAVICPGFSVDGLETLEEIAMEGKHTFKQQGGEDFHFVPCLNDSQYWIQACANLIRGG